MDMGAIFWLIIVILIVGGLIWSTINKQILKNIAKAVLKNFDFQKAKEEILAVNQSLNFEYKVVTDKCPFCGSNLVSQQGVYDQYRICSNSECKYTKNLTNLKCPFCGSKLVLRQRRYGQYWCCRNYPKCNYKRRKR